MNPHINTVIKKTPPEPAEPQILEFVAKAEDLEREINTALAGVAQNLAHSFGAISQQLLAVVDKDRAA